MVAVFVAAAVVATVVMAVTAVVLAVVTPLPLPPWHTPHNRNPGGDWDHHGHACGWNQRSRCICACFSQHGVARLAACRQACRLVTAVLVMAADVACRWEWWWRWHGGGGVIGGYSSAVMW